MGSLEYHFKKLNLILYFSEGWPVLTMIVDCQDLERLAGFLWEHRFGFGYLEALVINLETYQPGTGIGYHTVKVRNYDPLRDNYIDVDTLHFVWNNLSREPTRFKIHEKFEADLSSMVRFSGTSDRLLVRGNRQIGFQKYKNIFEDITSLYLGVRIPRHVFKKILQGGKNVRHGCTESLLMCNGKKSVYLTQYKF